MSPHESSLRKPDSRSKTKGSPNCLRHTERAPGCGQFSWRVTLKQVFLRLVGHRQSHRRHSWATMKTSNTEMSAAETGLKIPTLPSSDPMCYGNHALELACFFIWVNMVLTFPLQDPKGLKAQGPFFSFFCFIISPCCGQPMLRSGALGPVTETSCLHRRHQGPSSQPPVPEHTCWSSQMWTDCQALLGLL